MIELRETVLMALINNFQYEQGNLVNIVWILIYTFVRNTCVRVCVCVCYSIEHSFHSFHSDS